MTPTAASIPQHALDEALSSLKASLLRDYDNDAEFAHTECEAALMAYLRAVGHSEAADAYEECRDRVGFWYA